MAVYTGKPRWTAYPFELLTSALTDPKRQHAAFAAALVLYVLVWTTYGVIAKGSQDIHFDMGEALAWSREPALGYAKHPPLSAWIVMCWFSIFPLADWAYYLLAITTAASGLWIAWIMSGRWLVGEKRVAGLALLTLIPFYNFHALKFNANTILIPTWAATTLFFLRSFEKRELLSAAIAGIMAGAAVLGKYWSVILVMGLGVVALSSRGRNAYFRSLAPWVTIVAGLLTLGPHLVWLVHHNFEPFGYATDVHSAESFWKAAISIPKFLAGAAGYIAVPTILAALCAQPSIAALEDTIWPGAAERELAAKAFWMPLLVAICIAIGGKVRINSLWTMSMFSLVPVVLLSSPFVTIKREALVKLVTAAVALPILVTLVSPLIAYTIHVSGAAKHSSNYRLIAQAVEDAWKSTSTAPLSLVGGDELADGILFYLPRRTSTYSLLFPHYTPWVDKNRIAQQGIALICAIEDQPCIVAMESFASSRPGSKREEALVAREYLGQLGKRERYLIITIPPGASVEKSKS